MPARTIRTVCPRNCYCTCGMLVTVDDGRVTRIDGDPQNSATGGHVCLKGISYARRLSTPDRLLHPLRRTRDGRFERVTWDAALDDIASRLDRYRREEGPESVLYYEGSGSHGALGRLAMAFWHQFGGCTLTYGDLCWPSGLEATRLTYGANLHNHPRHTRESRFILLWGHNPAETNVHQMRLILDAQERGCRVALVDPRSTDTSDAVDLHLRPRPGTDAALALGLARVIVDRGLHDDSFLRQHAHGVDKYLDRLRDYPLDRVETITGVAANDIEALATAYATARPALLVAGFGLQRHHRAGQTMRAVALLPALTGNVGRPGGGWQYANLASHCLADPPLPPEPPQIRRSVPVSRLGPALEETHSPTIKAAWIEKANPASQNPQSDVVRRALTRMALVVVVDQFLTDTAKLADYVLPAKTMFEEEDLVTAYWHPYLQRRAKVFEPPGEVRTETTIWRSLCERLAFDTRFFPSTDEATATLLRGLLPDGITLDTLGKLPYDGGSPDGIAFADHSFPTPSGKVEFASAEAARLWGVDPVPDYQPLDEGHASPLASRYPLQLLSCKTRDRIHSQFGNLDWVRDIERRHRLDIHPLDAQARGLAEGDRAVVWNDRGRIELDVRLDEGLRPGVVHILEGRCHEGDPDVNQLTDAGVTDMNHGATFYETLVEVESVMLVGRRHLSVGADERRSETLVSRTNMSVGTDDCRSDKHVSRGHMSVGADERRSKTRVGRTDMSVGADECQSKMHVGRTDMSVGADERQSKTLVSRTNMSVGADECRSETLVSRTNMSVGTDECQSKTRVGRTDTSVGADECQSKMHVGRTDMSVGADECRSETLVSRTNMSVGADECQSKMRVGRIDQSDEGAKPVAGGAGQRGFTLDIGRCVGCGACVLACRLENGWPPGAAWRRVLPLNLRRRPAGPTYFLSVACHHCERPACVAACPSRAYTKRDDGVVVHAEDRCVGCRYCEMACPFGAPAYLVDRGVMSKCHLCHHRLDRGEEPACVAACPVDALRLSPTADGRSLGADDVPGFVDPAACRPHLRFIEPRQARRAELLAALKERLGRRQGG